MPTVTPVYRPVPPAATPRPPVNLLGHAPRSPRRQEPCPSDGRHSVSPLTARPPYHDGTWSWSIRPRALIMQSSGITEQPQLGPGRWPSPDLDPDTLCYGTGDNGGRGRIDYNSSWFVLLWPMGKPFKFPYIQVFMVVLPVPRNHGNVNPLPC